MDIRTIKSPQERNGGNAIKQLFNDFRLGLCISRRGKGREWHVQRPPQLADTQIVWPEIMAPLADTMRLIDRNHIYANAAQHLRHATRRQPLWRHIQELKAPLFQRLPNGVSFFLGIARGQRASLNPSFTQPSHLIAHQSNEWRNNDCHTVAHQGRQLEAQRLPATSRHNGKRVLP